MTDKNIPKIGVAVIVIRDSKILLGRRINSHGQGQWAFPGGHLEFGESPEECGIREVMEETGLNINQLRTGPYTNDVFITEGKHYITLFMIAESSSGIPQVKEPEKCLEWEWFEWDHLPAPLFLPIVHLKELGYHPVSHIS
ncbi:nucleotide triphosphate diphosphatase NUDT15 [Endozoicomonas numazuensis]|uniref:Nudix hydrolase domain-containing protein n=1 Tax=Endozoicomonas numazuensis TaxID=1137799 RepID=A0A081NCS7_9GAMM|nr:NUDIX hydrolase [Endozoicomonas numazuensis]KEQ16250.1 hypothetical protein GZ78_23840 [Endozoicomonas numazuensis]